MNLETKITIYKFTPQVFTLTQHPATKVESKGFLHYGKQVIFPDRY